MTIRRDGYDRVVLAQASSGIVVDVCKALWEATPTQADGYFVAASGKVFRRSRKDDFQLTALDSEACKWLRAMNGHGGDVYMVAMGNCNHQNWQLPTKLNVYDVRGGAGNFAGLRLKLESNVFDAPIFQSHNLLEGYPWRGAQAALQDDGTYVLKYAEAQSFRGPGWVGVAGDRVLVDGTLQAASSLTVRMVFPAATAKIKLSNCTGTVKLLTSDETVISTTANDVEVEITSGTWFVDVTVLTATDDPVLEVTDIGVCQSGREIEQPVITPEPPTDNLFWWGSGDEQKVRVPTVVEDDKQDTLYDKTANGYDWLQPTTTNQPQFEEKKTDALGVDVDPRNRIEFNPASEIDNFFTAPAEIKDLIGDGTNAWSMYFCVEFGGDHFYRSNTLHPILSFNSGSWSLGAQLGANEKLSLRWSPLSMVDEGQFRFGERIVVAVICDGASGYTVRLNGNTIKTGVQAAAAATLVHMGRTSGSSAWHGKFFEGLIYNVEHNALQIQTVEAYLETNNISPVTRVQGSQVVYSDTEYIYQTTDCPVQLVGHRAAYLPITGLIHVVGGEQGTYASPALVATHRTLNPVSGAWGTLQALPAARKNGHLFVIGDDLFYAGGWDGSGASNKTWKYDSVSDSWSAMNDMSAVVRFGQVCVWGGYGWVVGGYDAGGGLSCVLQRYDPVADNWTTNAGWDLPRPRVEASFVVSGTNAYLYGGRRSLFGCGGGSPSSAQFDHLSIDLSNPGAGWSTLASLGGLGDRGFARAIERDGKIYHGTGNANGDFAVYDVAGDDWLGGGKGATVAVLPQTTSTQYHNNGATAVYNGGLFIMGGLDNPAAGTPVVLTDTIVFVPPEGMDLV